MDSFRGVRFISLETLSVCGLPRHGEPSAAYVFRSSDDKEVLYIGSTDCLRRRLLGNYLGGVGGKTTQRIHTHLFDEKWISRIEVAWFVANEHALKESELKREYRATHAGKLPPWNKR